MIGPVSGCERERGMNYTTTSQIIRAGSGGDRRLCLSILHPGRQGCPPPLMTRCISLASLQNFAQSKLTCRSQT